jgi:hypothetical protein
VLPWSGSSREPLAESEKVNGELRFLLRPQDAIILRSTGKILFATRIFLETFIKTVLFFFNKSLGSSTVERLAVENFGQKPVKG